MQNISVVTVWWEMRCTSDLCETHREQNTHTLTHKTEERAGDNTRTRCNPLVCADVLCAKHEFRTLARFLDPSVTCNKESDSLPEPAFAY
jgi:hypothetical protein